MPDCSKCDKKIQGRQKKVSCAACKLEFHSKCQGVSDLKVEVLNETDDVLWFCKSCRVTTSNVVSKLSQFEVKFAEILSKEDVLKKEMAVMHKLITSLNERNKSLEKQLQEAEGKMEKYQYQAAHVERTIGNLYQALSEKEAGINEESIRVDQLEQATKAKNIRIAGVAEREDENLVENVIQLVADKMKISGMKAEDIKECHRMGKRRHGKNRDIVVQFKTKSMKDQVYQSRTKIQHEDNPIFFNEDLIPNRSKLFYHARKLRKAGKVYQTWSQEGNIMVKVREEDGPRQVQSYAELKQLTTNDDHNKELDTTSELTNDDGYYNYLYEYHTESESDEEPNI